MNNSLLPPSASEFMRGAEAATWRVSDLPVDLKTLWNPDECPVALLSYLAWALSVDRWDKNWSEATKRQVIKSAWLIHRQKGTVAALRRVVEPFGFLIKISEWWETGGEPGTFRLDIGVLESGITEETYLELERLINDAKPCSRHMVGLAINLQVSGNVYAHAASYCGDVMTVYPWTEESQESRTNVLDVREVMNGG
ncbi:phage tail protein I [Kluyvera cryocrescens]|uniref:phage tail protein I n=1 Tax=Kluyvera cryocrescens TaxID=580 RepID=UPI003D7FBD6E